jgi:DNA-binding MarR family transcriptional regulator
MDVLQQFRVIYGSMRQHFRAIEDRCGLSGSQMWILQEIQRSPEVGVTELAGRMGIHQSTCSQLVDKLVARQYLLKSRQTADHRRVGLRITARGGDALAALPGPAEGLLPEALAAIPEVALKTLNIHLSELIRHLPGKDDAFATTPLADIMESAEPDGV